MSRTAKVKVQKDVLKWTLETSMEYLNDKWINKINSWISEDSDPTFNQLVQLSKKADLPFGYFFLKTPPKREIPLLNFRTINNKKILKPSKELMDTIDEMENKVSWLKDYRENQGIEKVKFVGKFKNSHNSKPEDIASEILDYFGLEFGWNINHKNAFNHIRNLLSDYGITTIINGVVKNSTRRKLNQNEFRAFVLIDNYAPLIFINSRDSFKAKLFSLIHELVHIWYGKPELLNFNFENNPEYNNNKVSEQEINQVVENIIFPEKIFIEMWNKKQDFNILDKISYLSNKFGISDLAVSIRAKNLNIIGQNVIDEVKNNLENESKIIEKKRKSSKGGPDFYTTLSYKIDNKFAMDVIRSAQSGDTSYTRAFDLLDVNGTHGLNSLSEKIKGGEY